MKKGEITQTALIGIVLIIVAFLVITAVISTVFDKMFQDEGESASACRTTNVLSGATKIDENILGVPVNLKTVPQACKTFDKRLEGTRGQIMEEVSEMAAMCWWQWANGNWNGLLCDSIKSCDSHCFACYTFTIGEIKDAKEKYFTAGDLKEFMRTEVRYYETPPTEGEEKIDQPKKEVPVTYLQYIQYDGRGVVIFHDLTKEENFVFEPGKTYGIFYFEPHTQFWKSDSQEDKLKASAIFFEEFSEASKTCKVKTK